MNINFSSSIWRKALVYRCFFYFILFLKRNFYLKIQKTFKNHYDLNIDFEFTLSVVVS